jgi:inward rectifier potassium channel
VFARFSQTRSRLVFSSRAAIAAMDGVPTLMIRVGNERRGQIVNTQFRMTLTRTTRTLEGVTIYRAEDLQLVRTRAPVLSRSWMIFHRIQPGGPLYGDSAQSLEAAEAEITVEVVGVDDTSLQPVHARHTWFAGSIVWGARLADVISEIDGKMIVDLRNFHELVPSAPPSAGETDAR